VLPAELRASLAADVAGDPAPLLVAARDETVAAAAAPVVSASGRVRVRRADTSAGRGHVVVEPVADVASWSDAPADLEAELLAEVKRVAAAVRARFGACRVVCDLDAPRWRWHVFAPER
jgi:diadenosine tetraphosphate (Ap4A) HIT family hydrolase